MFSSALVKKLVPTSPSSLASAEVTLANEKSAEYAAPSDTNAPVNPVVAQATELVRSAPAAALASNVTALSIDAL